VLAIGGVAEEVPELRKMGLRAARSLACGGISREEAIERAAELIEQAAAELCSG